MVNSKSIMIVLMCFLQSITILLHFFKVMCSEVTEKSQISATNGSLNIQSKPLEINIGSKWKRLCKIFVNRFS